jgi:hypothetical protein
MGKKSKLKAKRREQQSVIQHTRNWTEYTPEMFAAYVNDCAANGAEIVYLLLTDRQNFRHLRIITKGMRYSIPVYMRFISNENPPSPIQKIPF